LATPHRLTGRQRVQRPGSPFSGGLSIERNEQVQPQPQASTALPPTERGAAIRRDTASDAITTHRELASCLDCVGLTMAHTVRLRCCA